MEINLKKLKEIIAKYKLEIIFLLLAFSICIASLLMYFYSTNYPVQRLQTTLLEEIKTSPTPDVIYVEIAGAVQSPGVYAMPKGNRLQTLIEKAGGLSMDANTQYMDLHINRALLLTDQQKIFIPRNNDSLSSYPLESLNTDDQSTSSNKNSESELIELNTASADSLEELPSVGPVTAEKIIKGRPYKQTDELVEKKILSVSLFSKIKDSIYIR